MLRRDIEGDRARRTIVLRKAQSGRYVSPADGQKRSCVRRCMVEFARRGDFVWRASRMRRAKIVLQGTAFDRRFNHMSDVGFHFISSRQRLRENRFGEYQHERAAATGNGIY